MSILLYNYKELTQCINEVERIEAKVKSKRTGLTVEEEEQEKEEIPTTLDNFLTNH
jgi:hypothetical protein